MEFTSASANKYLRRLQDEKDRLLRTEQEVSTYVLAEGEAAEPPAYDYGAVREKVAQIDGQARAIRHALHRFNMKTVLPERGITIDEALILLAQLSGRKERLNGSPRGSPRSDWATGTSAAATGPSSTGMRTTTSPRQRRTTAPSRTRSLRCSLSWTWSTRRRSSRSSCRGSLTFRICGFSPQRILWNVAVSRWSCRVVRCRQCRAV